jgi:hypothetical protein
MAPHLGHLRPPTSTVSLSASAIFSCLYVITYYKPVLGAGMVDGPGWEDKLVMMLFGLLKKK